MRVKCLARVKSANKLRIKALPHYLRPIKSNMAAMYFQSCTRFSRLFTKRAVLSRGTLPQTARVKLIATIRRFITVPDCLWHFVGTLCQAPGPHSGKHKAECWLAVSADPCLLNKRRFKRLRFRNTRV